jgi:hypothetical protein
VLAIADQACRRITKSVVSALQQQPGGLSGDGSPVRSFWDEFCLQVQEGESFFWDAYVATAVQFIEAELQRAPSHEQQAVWLQCESGWDWLWEVDNWEDGSEPLAGAIPYNAGEAADYIFVNFLCSEAEDFSNAAMDEYQRSSQRARFELDRLSNDT